MKIALAVKKNQDNSKINTRFGRTEYFMIYNNNDMKIEFVDNSDIKNQSQGVGPLAAQKIIDSGAKVVISGNPPGQGPMTMLRKFDIESYSGAKNMTVQEALEAYKEGKLNKC